MPQTVLVTGGAGYIGAQLVPLLLEDGYRVRVLDNLLYDQHSLIDAFRNENFEFIRGDVRDEETVRRAVHDVDSIVHLAAIVGAPACQRNESMARTVNLEGAKLVDDLREPDTDLVMASTGSVYGIVDGVCTEETEPDPLSLYAETKLQAEQYARKSGNVVVYRPATAFGLSNRLRLDLLVNDFTYQAVNNGFLVLYEKDNMRTFINVNDLARAFKFAIDNFADMKDEIYNVGHEDLNRSKEEVCELVQGHVDYAIHYTDSQSDPERRDYEVSYEKLRSMGFDVEISLSKGIGHLVDAYQMIEVKNPYSNYI